MTDAFLRVGALGQALRRPDRRTTICRSTSLQGELHAVIGPNGAGKTTLISQLSGELIPDSGTIQFARRGDRRLSGAGRVASRIGALVPDTQLLNDYSALDNVALAGAGAAGPQLSFLVGRAADRALCEPRAAETLDRVGLDTAPTCAVKSCRTASRSSSNWRSRWRRGRGCCCWMSRWLAWAPPNVRTMIDLLRKLKRERHDSSGRA